MKKTFSGIVAAQLTPYTKTGRVNHKELRRYIRHLINKGIDGFYVCGSTAEAFLLTQDERKEILETVVEENNGEKFIIAHVGDISTDFAVDLANHAKTAGADAISAISPFYYKYSIDEIKNYYFEIMDKSDMTMFIYNFPNYSGFSLTNEILTELRVNKHVAGVKFTSNDFYQMERMKTLNPDLVIWNGYDEMLLSGLAAGADGGIGSTYSCICPIIRGIYDNFRNGDLNSARSYQQKANDVIDAIGKYGVMASEKALLGFEGMEFNGCRKPFAPVSDDGIKELRKVYEKYILEK